MGHVQTKTYMPIYREKILFAHAHRCHPFAKPPLGSASHIAGTECHFWPAIRSASGTAAAIRPAPGQGCFRTLVRVDFGVQQSTAMSGT